MWWISPLRTLNHDRGLTVLLLVGSRWFDFRSACFFIFPLLFDSNLCSCTYRIIYGVYNY